MHPRPSRSRRKLRWPAAALASSLLLGSCTSDPLPDDALQGSIFVTGSSTVEPVSTRAAELFNDVEPGVEITVDGPGTGDGFRVFCQGDADMIGASRAIMPLEEERCERTGVDYVELEVAIDGLSMLTSARTEGLECLNFFDLYALIGPEARGINTWSEAGELAAELGSSTAFPDHSLRIIAPGTESGTYDSFVELVIEPIAEERAAAGHLDPDDVDTTRPDYTSASDDNTILTNIGGGVGTIGWVGYAFAEEAGADIRQLAVSATPDGECVTPSSETIADGTYPLARPLFFYLDQESVQTNPALVAFLDFALGEGYERSVTTALGTTGYVPLAPEDLVSVRQVWERARDGAAGDTGNGDRR